MFLTTDERSLRIYEALASPVRLQIIDLLNTREMHVKELAEALYLSNAIVSTHVRKLHDAGLVAYRVQRHNGATYKLCSLSAEYLQIKLTKEDQTRERVEVSLPVGQFTGFEAVPTCGLATTERLIGQYDDPTYFLDPDRVHAGILWLGKGYVEYKIPNYLYKDQQVTEIEISMEIGSEAPRVEEHWPSDIRFELNETVVGTWTSPGDFGGSRGRYTPAWWDADVNQYGLLKVLRINKTGTYMDGQRISDVTVQEVKWERRQWTLRIGTDETHRPSGGLTLFGRGFGNYDQDIVVRSYYR